MPYVHPVSAFQMLFISKFISKKGFRNTEVTLEQLCKFTLLGEAQVLFVVDVQLFCTALCLEFGPRKFCGNGCEIGKKPKVSIYHY